MVGTCLKWLEMAGNDWIWLSVVGNGSKWLEWLYMAKTAQNIWKWLEWLYIAGNGWNGIRNYVKGGQVLPTSGNEVYVQYSGLGPIGNILIHEVQAWINDEQFMQGYISDLSDFIQG